MKKKRQYGSELIFLLVSMATVLWIPEGRGGSVYPPPSGRSASEFPFDIPVPPSDTYVVNDTGSPTLDKYLFRGDDEFDIIIPIDTYRYVGDVESLLANDLISKTFKIYIPAHDVDSSAKPRYDCDGDDIIDSLKAEVDEVYFNHSIIGILTGEDDKWNKVTFEVDITQLNFPNQPDEVGHNYIGIRIDTANENVVLSSGQIGCKKWATEVDWAGIQFEVTSPVVFVPGLSGFAGAFETSGYKENLFTQTGIPSEIITHSAFVPSLSACDTEVTPSLKKHAEEMYQTIKGAAEHFGADSVHLIAHSKGGLDSRFFLKYLPKEPLQVQVGEMGGQPVLTDLTVSSFVTHGSPHAGTVVADYIVAGVPFAKYVVSDLCDLTTWVMREVNMDLKYPAGVTTLMIGADADQNGDGELDDNEVEGNQVGKKWSNKGYKWLRDVASVRGEYEERFDTFSMRYEKVWVLREEPTLFPQPNDTMVTAISARSAYGYPNGAHAFKNHGTVIDTEVQNYVIEQGIALLLNWRLR